MHPAHLQGKLIAVPNPVYPAEARAVPHIPCDEGRYRLLSVGRLCYQKNFESLIVAFSRLASRFPSWDLNIVGEGENRDQLDALILKMGLSSRVRLPGATRNISACYASSHLFCLPSRWEGFPNALAEALAHGLPSVGYAECAGTNVLIEHGRTGLLAEGNGDPESLSHALAAMMGDATKRRTMGDTAISSIARFEPKIVMDRWEEVLRRAAT
jgi:glycosyltransferase involved in cell wall biosynthesis